MLRLLKERKRTQTKDEMMIELSFYILTFVLFFTGMMAVAFYLCPDMAHTLSQR